MTTAIFSCNKVELSIEKLSLELLNIYSINVEEPSGLDLAIDNESLWTVSDRYSKIYQLDLMGQILQEIDIPGDNFEGITVDFNDHSLWVVQESLSELLQVDILGNELQRIYVAGAISGSGGLEGITIHPNTGNIYVLKESGLLIEISGDLSTILMYYNLDFADDYSGICFENANSNRVWISSDTSERIYLFDLNSNMKLKAFKLEDSKGKAYPSAEGITYDLDNKNLYLVTDDGHRLYKYEVK